jgi:AraC family transcriptional regulator
LPKHPAPNPQHRYNRRRRYNRQPKLVFKTSEIHPSAKPATIWHRAMQTQLSSGQFYGRAVRRKDVGGLHLIETRYAPGARVPRHSHRHGYFCLVRRGHYREEYAGRVRSCGPLTVAFHPPGEEHAEEFAGDETWSFNVEVTDSWLARWPGVWAGHDWDGEFQGGAVAGLALRLHGEFLREDTASALAIEGLTLEILAESLRRSTPVVGAAPPRWLTRVRETLHDGFAEPHALGELAAVAGVHPVYVATAFRRHFGCSVGEYLRRRRIDFACQQLATARAALAEIAFSAGFADQSHFTRVFKRLTGFTPAAYRQAVRRP